VLVWPNTYVENINFNDHQIVLGSLFLTTGDTSYITTTILDGDSSNSVIINDNWHDSLSQITGFTIRNGNAPYCGGGIISYGGACVIRNNNIHNNISTHYGGGIHLEDSPIIMVENNTIAYNYAEDIGGGLLFYAEDQGGLISNNVIVGNSCVVKSGLGIYYGDYTIINNTIADNSLDVVGIRFFEYCNATLINNIIWNNADTEIVIDPNATVTITYCDILGGMAGEGNIDSDPLFCEPESGDYQLAENSPCLGAGFESANIGALGIGCEATGVYDNDNALPVAFQLDQNYPNPFNGSTTIGFSLSQPRFVELAVYDLLGRKIQTLVNDYLPAGINHVNFDASTFSSGVYFYYLKTGDFSESKRMVLIK